MTPHRAAGRQHRRRTCCRRTRRPDKQDASTETEVRADPQVRRLHHPHEKLAEAREARKAAQDRIAQLEQQVAELTSAQQRNLAAVQADAQDRANAGQAQTAADEPRCRHTGDGRRRRRLGVRRPPKRIWQRASPS